VSKPDFVTLATEIGKLVEEKNAAYGSSFAKCGEFLRILYPDGIQPDQYHDALLIVRIFDKLMRIATAKDALGESPYRDIAGYGLLGASTSSIEPPPPVSAEDVASTLVHKIVEKANRGASWARNGNYEQATAALLVLQHLSQELLIAFRPEVRVD
jgi:hypothetical protein